MCGFAGVVGVEPGIDGAGWTAWAASRMVRRGPDGSGTWNDEDAGAHLAFRRLAIIDLGSAGAQPMVGPSGRSVLVFNGELYGHTELRRRLEGEGIRFRGRSDTEVVVAALERWGIAALDRFDGMFALAWYRPAERRLVLARDHAGIKPLFIGRGPRGRGLSFASQYDVVVNGPWGRGEVDPEALALYLELHHVPAPYGMMQGTGQLEPGEFVEVVDGKVVARRSWWTLPAYRPDHGTTDLAERLDETVSRVLEEQLISDRPVGTFLSGGVDSALVTAHAARCSTDAVEAFTIAFPGERNDEEAGARSFASAIGVSHHVRAIGDAEAVPAVEDALSAATEPVGDFSIIPTCVLSNFAAENVTVALSGDGGDELFFGYVRPWSLMRSGRWFAAPHAVRRSRYLAGRLPLVPQVSEAVSARSAGDYYRGVNSRTGSWLRELGPELPAPPPLPFYTTAARSSHRDLVELSRSAEYYGQLQRVLRKVDLASMRHSLEVRVPLLSRRVIEISATVDVNDGLRGGDRKGPLRDALHRALPGTVQQTEKHGFTPPLTRWLEGPLRDRVADQMHAPSWRLDGLLDPRVLRRLDDPTISSRHWRVWTVLALEWWLDGLVGAPAWKVAS